MARDVGIEPTSKGLEALVLPLDQSRICLDIKSNTEGRTRTDTDICF